MFNVKQSLPKILELLAWYGLIFGTFPAVRTNFTYKRSDLGYRLWLVVLPILYFILVDSGLTFAKSKGQSLRYPTDSFALNIFVLSHAVSKAMLHVVLLTKTRKILNCFHAIHEYDVAFRLQNTTTLVNLRTVTLLVMTTFAVVTSFLATLPESYDLIEKHYLLDQQSTNGTAWGGSELVRTCWSLKLIPNFVIVALIAAIGALLSEISMLYMIIMTEFFFDCLLQRLGQLAEDISKAGSLMELNQGVRDTAMFSTFEVGWTANYRHFRHKQLPLNVSGLLRKMSQKFNCLEEICTSVNSMAQEIILIFIVRCCVMFVMVQYLIIISFSGTASHRSEPYASMKVLVIGFLASYIFLVTFNFVSFGQKLKDQVISFK